MNPKIDKLAKEIERTKEKIAELQGKVREMEKQKTELENTDIVAIVRSLNLSPQQLADFIRGRQENPAADYAPAVQEDNAHEN